MKISGLLDTTNSFIIKKMLLGLQRLHKRVDSRRPITIDLLVHIFYALLTYASLTNEIQQIHQLVKMQKRQVKNKTKIEQFHKLMNTYTVKHQIKLFEIETKT
jgi:truncated hemoglobin YjbI